MTRYQPGMRKLLLALFGIGVVLWGFFAFVTFVWVPLSAGDGGAQLAGGMHLQHALDDMPINLEVNLRLAKDDCDRTPWASQKLRQAHEDLEAKRQPFLMQKVSLKEYRASIEEALRMTEAEGREAHAQRWAGLKFWLWVDGAALLVFGLAIAAYPQRR